MGDTMDLGSIDAVETARLIRQGDVELRDVVMAAWTRIRALDPALGFMVHSFDPEEAIERAEDGPEAAPLRGVPFLFKDELELAGRPMTLGSRLLSGFEPAATHPAATRMLSAGLVPLGRTKMSELGLLPITEPAAYGPTHNPWITGRSPGGSSGGAAAAVAAGAVPIAHAADGGGSIRIPASACGLVGLKPSRGRLPAAPSDPPAAFVVHGCLSRTVRDTAAFLQAVSAVRPSSSRLALPPTHPPSDRRLRIGITRTGMFDEEPDAAVAQALDDAAETLRRAGHAVERVDPPVDVPAFTAAFRVLWAAGAGVFLRRVHQALLEKAPDWTRSVLDRDGLFRALVSLPRRRVEPFTLRLARWQDSMTPSALWLAEQNFARMESDFSEFFSQWDLWMGPTLMRPPVDIGGLETSGSDDDVEQSLLSYVGWLPVANATGLPAISVPSTPAPDGQPLGVQFMAPWGADQRLIDVASELERLAPWPLIAHKPA